MKRLGIMRSDIDKKGFAEVVDRKDAKKVREMSYQHYERRFNGKALS